MMFRIFLSFALLFSLPLTAQKKFLFDATKAETAGNADWVIDADGSPQRFPTPDQSTVTASTAENYWTGALSAWGIALVKMGHRVETLPSGTAISYGSTSNAQDLTKYDVFIVDEPNTPFTAAEKTAMMLFVQNGGGLFMISDHGAADRNSDGWDAVRVWNDLFRNNSVQSLPFGMLLDSNSISQTSSNVWLASPIIINGPAGQAIQCKFSAGSTITLNTAANATVRGVVWQSGASQSVAKVMVAYAKFGKGKVVLVGDSSPADDGTGASGNSLYPGWTEIGVSHANIHLNGSLWLAEKETTTTAVEQKPGVPLTVGTLTSFPNPFNPAATIRFTVPVSGHAVVTVADLLGRECAILFDGMASTGREYEVRFNASRFASGWYAAILKTGSGVIVRPMTLVR